MKVHQIETGGRRCVRVAAYAFQIEGEEPEPRIMLAPGWIDDPVVPVSAAAITLPASALPELLTALQGLQGAE